MTRSAAIDRAVAQYDTGVFHEVLARRIAIPSESQNPERSAALMGYLAEEMRPALERIGFTCRLLPNPDGKHGPFLIGERMEGAGLPTVFTYGHGDVIRGQDEQWAQGLSPWRLQKDGRRLYGRGTADNKGQHTINLTALESVLATRGKLGFNLKILIETGEETGSPGLRELCAAERERLRADVLIASDGPRLTPERATLYLGTRGAFNFDLNLTLREGGHHSGNWGGLLANPGIVLAHAIASITTVAGQILIPEWLPPPMPASVKRALADCVVDGGPDGPTIDTNWGEPGFSPAERVFGWNSFEVLAYRTGNPDRPVNAIPHRASAHCQIRFVAGSDHTQFLPALRRHLDRRGYGKIELSAARDSVSAATRLDPDHPWVRWAVDSVIRTTGKKPAVLPNLGGTLPNDIFADLLGLPTVWVPHSYASCSQHAPNEHMLEPIVREGLAVMAGLFWDLGEGGVPARTAT
ncbi:MAG: M20 peptidase family dipeptidase [Alphaproteobacteria bacterium]|nr:M20 peptidase family dipeptidase [Alphaproteobacteria bacterium]